MTGAVPKVAVIGRQNVGKSTLVNRLFGKRTAIAHEMPGVTRDRLELQTTWGGRTFALVDTAGYLPHARGIEALAAGQAARAMAEADVILLVVDVQTGITEDDAALVRRLGPPRSPSCWSRTRRTRRRTSRTSPFPIAWASASRSRCPPCTDRGPATCSTSWSRSCRSRPRSWEEPEERRFVIVGRPNVGKSSLFNRLLGQDFGASSRRWPARPATASTRWSSGRATDRALRGPAGIAAGSRCAGSILQLPARRRGDRRGTRGAVGPRRRRRLHHRGQEDREARDGGGPRPPRDREQVGSCSRRRRRCTRG